MMDFDAFHKVIDDRVRIESELHGGDPLWQWEMMVDQFSFDIADSISFVKMACSDDELYWLSEVFAELLQKTKSHELLNCLRERAALVQDEEMRKEIQYEIEDAVGVAGLGQ